MQPFKLMICVPGINTNPELWTCWPNQVCPRINRMDGWKSQPFLYQTDALTVDVAEDERIQTLVNILEFYAIDGIEIHLMAHSNGARVVVAAIQKANCKIKTLHLICGAIDGNYNVNGLNDLVSSGKIEAVFNYWGGQDQAMRLEDTLAGKALFGIKVPDQPLGLAGPVSVLPELLEQNRVQTIEWPENDHSTCWESENIDHTVLQVLNNAVSL